jgi:hypothetical protein
MTSEALFLRPLSKPSMVHSPILKVSLDGELISRTSLIESRIAFPIEIKISGTAVIPSLSPFLRPSIMVLPILFPFTFLARSSHALSNSKFSMSLNISVTIL